MAKLAQLSHERNGNVPVLIQFCGTSRGSNTGLSLMRSLCVQIIFLYRENKLPFVGEVNEDNLKMLTLEAIPSVFKEMVKHFHFLLANFVCTVYIDSLDQLSNQDMARRNVSFLNGVKPHPDTRIIVSMLPDEEFTRQSTTIEDGDDCTVVCSTISTLFVFQETSSNLEEPKYWYGPHSKKSS